MKFESQTAKEEYLNAELSRFGDHFYPTRQHMKHLEEVTDTLPIGSFSRIEKAVLTLGDHIRYLVDERRESSSCFHSDAADRLQIFN